MIEVILAASETAAQPGPLQTWGPLGAAILVLGSPKGAAVLKALLARNGNGNSQAKPVCPLHDDMAKDVREIRDDVKRLTFHLLDNKKT